MKATARLERDGGDLRLEIAVAIRDGWHVNSNRPLSDDLIPTVLSAASGPGAWALEDVRYPRAETVRLSFQDEPLAVYQGEVRLSARVTPGGDEGPASVVSVRLKIQACDDRVCLRPEELVLEVPAAGAM